MPKPKIQQFRRPVAAKKTKEFIDPLLPDEPIALTMRVEHNLPAQMIQQTKAEDYVQMYMRGEGIPGTEGYIPPAPLPPMGGGDVRLSESLLNTVAFLETYEMPPPGDEKWGLLDWLACSVNAPTAFADIVNWCNELNAEAQSEAKNAPGAATSPS